jgi:hypothetical protein
MAWAREWMAAASSSLGPRPAAAATNGHLIEALWISTPLAFSDQWRARRLNEMAVWLTAVLVACLVRIVGAGQDVRVLLPQLPHLLDALPLHRLPVPSDRSLHSRPPLLLRLLLSDLLLSDLLLIGRGCGVRGEIMRSQECGIVGRSQSVLVMINPIIFTRTRTIPPGGVDAAAGGLGGVTL